MYSLAAFTSPITDILLGAERQRPQSMLERRFQVKRRGDDLQSACLDFTDIQDVVEDLQQRFGGAFRDPEVLLDLALSPPVSLASTIIPMTPPIGVRISCDMFARNSLLARVADSARRRASASAW